MAENKIKPLAVCTILNIYLLKVVISQRENDNSSSYEKS